jgi:hypothetical protein
MFWNKKKKPPITEEDEEWIELELMFLKEILGEKHFDELITITPTREFFDFTFKGNEEDSEYVLKRVKELMYIDDASIKLCYFSDEPIKMDDGTILSSPAESNGEWKSAAGIYEDLDDEKIIYIERGQLKNTFSLIATIAHELAHYILLTENRIEENDEYLTDLTAIVYGFGIFMGNSRFQFIKNQNSNFSEWQMSSQGYLPEQVIAYTMAWLSNYRKENTEYKKFFSIEMTKYFNQSVVYLMRNN